MTRFQRDLVRYARDKGVRDAHLVHGGKHGRVVGTFAGKPICMIVAASPSDTNAPKQAKRWLNRTLRGMGAPR